VVIADGQSSFRKFLRSLLEREADITVAGEASDAPGVSALTRELRPNVLLIDVSLFRRLERGAAGPCEVITVVIIPAPDPDSVLTSFLEGARAIVPRAAAPFVWPDSIRTVVAGRYWLDDESIAILLSALRDYAPHRRETRSQTTYRLTSREAEIMNQIACGRSNKEVGEVFSICERTVKHHLTNIFAKIGVSSRLELALFALTHRLAGTSLPLRATIPIGRRNPPQGEGAG
jgi:DNA-binding NarL/FixJ family response regulator